MQKAEIASKNLVQNIFYLKVIYQMRYKKYEEELFDNFFK
jgi:hypothetical protein